MSEGVQLERTGAIATVTLCNPEKRNAFSPDMRRELTALMGISGEPVFARLFRWTRQSPQYEVGHQHRVATIEQHVASLPGVFITGSGFRAIGIPDCIADGRDTAAKAAAFVAAAPR